MTSYRARHIIAPAAVALLVLGQHAAIAGAARHKKPVKHTRTITYDYTNPCMLVTPAVEAGYCSNSFTNTNKRTERYLAVKAVDKTGRPVAFAFQDQAPKVDTSGQSAPSLIICGSATKIPISPGGTFTLAPVLQVGSDTSCPLPATAGTVTIRVSNLP